MRVAVLGAGGRTGRLAVAALVRRGADVLACGRRLAPLEDLARAHPGVQTRVVDASRRPAVDGVARDVDAVVNVAGPFLASGTAAAEAAVARSIPYADTTGEQAFMRLVRDRLHADALAAGSPVVCSLAFEYALADLVVRARLPEGGDRLEALYRPRGVDASPGTRRSVLRALVAPAVGYEDGRLVPDRPAARRRTFATLDGPRGAVSFPGGEILTVPWHTPYRTVRTWLPATPARARIAGLLAPAAAGLLRGPALRLAERAVKTGDPAAPPASGRGEIYLESTRDGRAESLLIETPDPYLTTAETVAEGVLRLVREPQGGVLAPAEALDAADLLAALARTLPGFAVARLDAGPDGAARRRPAEDETRI